MSLVNLILTTLKTRVSANKLAVLMQNRSGVLINLNINVNIM